MLVRWCSRTEAAAPLALKTRWRRSIWGMQAGADGFELDVQLSADGVPVVHHDRDPGPDDVGDRVVGGANGRRPGASRRRLAFRRWRRLPVSRPGRRRADSSRGAAPVSRCARHHRDEGRLSRDGRGGGARSSPGSGRRSRVCCWVRCAKRSRRAGGAAGDGLQRLSSRGRGWPFIEPWSAGQSATRDTAATRFPRSTAA